MIEKIIDIKKLDIVGIGATGRYLFIKKENGFYIVTNGKEHLVMDEEAIKILKKEFEEWLNGLVKARNES